MKKLYTILTIVIIIGAIGVFWIMSYVSEPTPPAPQEEPLTLDPQKEVTHLSKVSDTEDAHWVRSGWVSWNSIEA
jgi:hypothetical protein